MGSLAKELEDFSVLQADALKSLRHSHPSPAQGLTISAAMASKLFDVLATKLELLRELRDGILQHRADEAVEAAKKAGHEQSSSGPLASAIRNIGSKDATKQSLGMRFAQTIAADGIDAIAKGTSIKFGSDAAKNAARSFLAGREGSSTSSAASWKNDFHEAVMRTMMQSESPEETLAGVVSRMPTHSRSVSHPSDGRRSPSMSSTSGTERSSSEHRDERRRSARRRIVTSVSPSPAPPHVQYNAVDPETKSRLVELGREVDDLQSSTSELLGEANRIISDCDEAVLQLSTENESLRREIANLQGATAARRRADDDCDAKVNQSVKSLNHSLSEARKETAALTRLLEEERGRHASVRSELFTLQEEFQAASSSAAQQGEALKRSRDTEKNLRNSLSQLQDSYDTLEARRAEELNAHNDLLKNLRLRIQSLETEASTHFADLESTRKSLAESHRKLERKQSELKDVKVLFTELESSNRSLTSELHALRSVVGEKDNAISRYANLSRLKERHCSPGKPAPTALMQDFAGPSAGASPQRYPAQRLAGSSSLPTATVARRGSQGRLVRLSFDSPARASTPPLVATQESALPMKGYSPSASRHNNTNAHHVQKVLADAASLLATIQKTRRSAGELAEHAGGRGTPDVPPSLQAMNGSEDGVAPVTPLNRPVQSQQQLLHDLEDKERHLMAEAASLAEQERSLLDKRSVVSSTLLAQRNQMLMKSAPDEEVEKLNNQISAVMERINQTTAQIQQNKRSVEAKMDLMQRQRRAVLAAASSPTH